MLYIEVYGTSDLYGRVISMLCDNIVLHRKKVKIKRKIENSSFYCTVHAFCVNAVLLQRSKDLFLLTTIILLLGFFFFLLIGNSHLGFWIRILAFLSACFCAFYDLVGFVKGKRVQENWYYPFSIFFIFSESISTWLSWSYSAAALFYGLRWKDGPSESTLVPAGIFCWTIVI